MIKTRRRLVEVAKSTHCHIGRAEVTEHVDRAVRTAADESKVEISRKGGCVTIRTLELRDVADERPARLGAAPATTVVTLVGAGPSAPSEGSSG